MCHASHYVNLILGKQVVDRSVAICLDPSFVLAKVIGEILALLVCAEFIPSRRGITAGLRLPFTP